MDGVSEPASLLHLNRYVVRRCPITWIVFERGVILLQGFVGAAFPIQRSAQIHVRRVIVLGDGEHMRE